MIIQEIKKQLDKQRDIKVRKEQEKLKEERRQEKLKFDNFVQSLSEGLNKARLASTSPDAYYTDDLSNIYFIMDMWVLRISLDFCEEKTSIMKDIVSELQGEKSENYIEELLGCFIYSYNRDRQVGINRYQSNAYYRLTNIYPRDRTSPKVKLALDIIKSLAVVYYKIETLTPSKQPKQDNQTFLDKLINLFKKLINLFK